MRRHNHGLGPSRARSAHCLPMLLVIAMGCGHYPPPVDTAADVRKVSTSEKSIHTRGLSDDDIPSLARLRNLTYISFGAGVAVEKAKISDKGLERLAKLDLPQLATLDLGACDKITDDGVANVCQMQSLKTLLLWGCPKITDGVIAKLTDAEHLTYLDLRGCPGITDRGLETLATQANWEHLELGGAPNVTAQGVAKLRTALPNTTINKRDGEWRDMESHIKR